MIDGPTHWLDNVGGDPHHVRTACGCATWATVGEVMLDPHRSAEYAVTCPECLLAMCDTPTVVEA